MKPPRGETLTHSQRKWINSVAAGMSDIEAYIEATGATRENAAKNAWRMRTNLYVLRALEVARRAEAVKLSLTINERLGLLAKIALTGKKNTERIRAMAEYSKLNADYTKVAPADDSQAGRVSMVDLIDEAQNREE